VAALALRASSLRDAIGIGWFLREVDGVGAVGYGGSANGQFAELLTAPERGFACPTSSPPTSACYPAPGRVRQHQRRARGPARLLH
jgi:hypothetical protein